MSTNLLFDQLASGQSQPEQTVNDALGQVDAAISESLDVSLASANATLTTTQFRRNLRFVGTGMTVARSITVQAIRHLFIVSNPSGTYNLSVILGTTTVVLAPGQTATFYTSGAANDLILIAPGVPIPAAPAVIYQAESFNAGVPGASQIMLQHVFTVGTTVAINFPLSQAIAGVAATAITTFDIQKNGGSIGSLEFAASGTTGTFTVASAQTFAAGDILSIIAPGSADATLADVSITVQTLRS